MKAITNNLEILYLLTIVFFSVLIKWVILTVFFDNYLYTNILLAIQDTQYFPLVVSFSNLEFNPSYLSLIESSKIISFPIFSVFFHSLLFKFTNVYSLIILEFLFQLIFFFIFYLTISKIFENKKKSLFFCLLIISLPLILEVIYHLEFSKLISLTKYQLLDNFGSRFPRPLTTGIFYFLFYLIIFKMNDEYKFQFNFKLFVMICLILSIFLNSFFYYFINFTILFLFLIIKNNYKSYKLFFKDNKKKIFLLLLLTILFISPFIIQLILSESDYSNRIGMISVSFEKKLNLVEYYLFNLFRIEFLILIIPCFLIHKYLNYKNFSNKKVDKINMFFYLIIVSIFSPLIFFILSPFLISIYHFLDILIFSCIFYLLLTSYFIFLNKFTFYKKFEVYRIFLYLFLIIYCSSSFILNKKHFIKLNNASKEINEVQTFFEKEKLKNTNFKLFTNDLNVMNLWLFNSNSELTISDGFTNSLSNSQIEFNFINNLKDFGISENNFKKIISFNKSEISSHLIYILFCYRYQANSLYSFSDIKNYTSDTRDIIINASPFRAQLQIMPEDEKIRLIKSFNNHNIDKKFLSDYVILNNSLLNIPLSIINDDYLELYRSENFVFYKRNLM